VESNIWALHIDARTGKPVGRPERVTSGPDAKPLESVSTDGRRMAFVRYKHCSDGVYHGSESAHQDESHPLQRPHHG